MKARVGRRGAAEPIGLCVCGLALVWAGTADVDAALGVTGDGALSFSLPVVCYQYGILLCLIGLASFLMGLRGRSISGEIGQLFGAPSGQQGAPARPEPVSSDNIAGWITAFAGILGLALRLWFATAPMRYDEAFCFETFVRHGLRSVFYYPIPNNHVLGSLLEYCSVKLLGSSPLAIRMPSILAGVLLIPLTSAVCRRLNRGRTAGFAALAVAVDPYLVLYSANGRGYSLQILAVLLLVYAALDAQGRLGRRASVKMSLLAALALWIMPSSIYALAGIALWLSLLSFDETRSWKAGILDLPIPFLGVTAFLSSILYLPVALLSGGLQAVTANRWVAPLPFAAFLQAIPGHVLAVLHFFSAGLGSFAVLLLAVLAIVGMHGAARRGQTALALLLPSMLGGAAAVFMLKRSIPFERTWLYFLPPLFASADAAAAALIDRRPALNWYASTGGSVLAAAYAIWLASSPVVEALSNTPAVPDAEAMARHLAPRIVAADRVCAEFPADTTVRYYLWRELTAAEAEAGSADATTPAPGAASPGRAYFVFHAGSATPARWNAQGLQALAAIGDLALYTGQDSAPLESQVGGNCWTPALDAQAPPAAR